MLALGERAHGDHPMRFTMILFVASLFMTLAPLASAEGGHPLPEVAETTVSLGAGGPSGDHAIN